MAASMTASEILDLCLFFAGGDTDVTLAALAEQAESFQMAYDRHFGISRTDFRCALFRLVLENGYLSDQTEPNQLLDDKQLTDWVPIILRHDEVYFNDEGEHWLRSDSNPVVDTRISETSPLIKYITSLVMNMKVLNPEEIRPLFESISLGTDLAFRLSRPGRGS